MELYRPILLVPKRTPSGTNVSGLNLTLMMRMMAIRALCGFADKVNVAAFTQRRTTSISKFDQIQSISGWAKHSFWSSGSLYCTTEFTDI